MRLARYGIESSENGGNNIAMHRYFVDHAVNGRRPGCALQQHGDSMHRLFSTCMQSHFVNLDRSRTGLAREIESKLGPLLVPDRNSNCQNAPIFVISETDSKVSISSWYFNGGRTMDIVEVY